MFIVRRRKRLEQIEKTEAKRILVPSSVRNPSVSVPTLWWGVRVGVPKQWRMEGRGEKSAKKDGNE